MPDGPPALTPSIVAANRHDSLTGFIVSWAGHDEGIDLLALRPTPPDDTLRVIDSAGIYGINRIDFSVKVGQYPTLATVDIPTFTLLSYATVSGTVPDGDTMMVGYPNPTAVVTVTLPRTHLAWQQGDGVDGGGERIFYTEIASSFLDPNGQPSLVADSGVEHVSSNLSICSAEHPSIAADSVRVGVSFEMFGATAPYRHVALRFRDTLGVNPVTGQPTRSWVTYTYRWGGDLTTEPPYLSSTNRHVRPSLTLFPRMTVASLTDQPEGGLTWFWQNNDEGRGHPQYLYRFGWSEAREIGDGAHPSLTLVPLRSQNPFQQTSILYRGDSAKRVTGVNDEGEDVWYYTGRLINTPGAPIPALFASGQQTGGIMANIRLALYPYVMYCDQDRPPIFDYGLRHDYTSIGQPDDDRHGPGDPTPVTSTPGLPPTFFEAPGEGRTILETLNDGERITRTSIFIANDEDVSIERYVSISDSISLELDVFPFDTVRSTPADLWTVVELVRASDSAVLWRGDTISARHLDTTGTGPVEKTLSVPVATEADSGEVVWIQVRAFASHGLDPEVSGGFTFIFDVDPGAPGAKRVIREEKSATVTEEALLALQVVPNPIDQGRATLHVSSRREGTIEVSIWDARGIRVGTLPRIAADRAGTYSVEVDLEGVGPGTYVLRATSGGVVASTQIVVLR